MQRARSKVLQPTSTPAPLFLPPSVTDALLDARSHKTKQMPHALIELAAVLRGRKSRSDYSWGGCSRWVSGVKQKRSLQLFLSCSTARHLQ